MLPRSRRIPRVSFPSIMRRGRLRQTKFLALRFLPSPGRPRFTVVVGRSVAPGAVARNLWRRRMRAAIHQRLRGGGIEASGDYILFLKPAALELPFSQLREEIARIFYSL